MTNVSQMWQKALISTPDPTSENLVIMMTGLTDCERILMIHFNHYDTILDLDRQDRQTEVLQQDIKKS